MDKLRPHSFATRLVVAFVGAAVALMLFIGLVSSLFTFGLYARTSNEVIASTSRTLERRIAEGTVLGPRLVADLARPRIHVAVYGDDGRLITESGPPREPAGFVGAVASLMGLHRARVQAPGGFAIISADLNQLDETLQAYWMWMLPLGMLAVVAAWG